MDYQIVLYPYNRILFSHNKQNMDTYLSIDYPWKKIIQVKTDIHKRPHIAFISNVQNGKSIEVESTPVTSESP